MKPLVSVHCPHSQRWAPHSTQGFTSPLHLLQSSQATVALHYLLQSGRNNLLRNFFLIWLKYQDVVICTEIHLDDGEGPRGRLLAPALEHNHSSSMKYCLILLQSVGIKTSVFNRCHKPFPGCHSFPTFSSGLLLPDPCKSAASNAACDSAHPAPADDVSCQTVNSELSSSCNLQI